MSIPLDAENQRVDALVGAQRPPIPATVSSPGQLAELRSRWERTESTPVLLTARSEGTDNSWGGLDVRTLLRGEHSAGRFAVHSIVVAPGAGLPVHYFDDTHVIILVEDGDLELTVGATSQPVGRYSLGYAPPHTRYGFRNRSGEPATVSIVHSPAGADRAFAAAHEHGVTTDDMASERSADVLAPFGFRFDDAPLPNDALTNAGPPAVDFEVTGPGDLETLREAFERRPAVPRLVVTTPDEFDAAAAGASRRKHLLTGDDSGGTAMLNMISGLPGMAAAAHHQPTEEEFFFVGDGPLAMICGTASAVLGRGAFAFCPRNTTHAFENVGTSEARFVTLNSPAGHERSMAAVRQRMIAGAEREDLHALAAAGGFVFHSLDAFGAEASS